MNKTTDELNRQLVDLRHRVEALRTGIESDEEVIRALRRREVSLAQLRWLTNELRAPLRAVILRLGEVRRTCANHEHRLWIPHRATELAMGQSAIPADSLPNDEWTRGLRREPILSTAALAKMFKPVQVEAIWGEEVELHIVQQVISGPECLAERQLIDRWHYEGTIPPEASINPAERERLLTFPLTDLLNPSGMLGYDLTRTCPLTTYRVPV